MERENWRCFFCVGKEYRCCLCVGYRNVESEEESPGRNVAVRRKTDKRVLIDDHDVVGRLYCTLRIFVGYIC